MKAFLFAFICLMAPAASVYEFKKTSIEGDVIDFTKYKGKTLLIVNTASKCGFTPQYAELQKLNDQYGSNITILGFPANNFGGQQPGSNSEISEFCQKNYGVTFQMFEKVSVKGDDQDALFKFLKDKTGQEPSWNFCKYLVKPDGTIKFFASKVSPLDSQIINEIN